MDMTTGKLVKNSRPFGEAEVATVAVSAQEGEQQEEPSVSQGVQPFADPLVVEDDETLVRQGLSPHTMRRLGTSVVGQWVKTRKNGSHEVTNVSLQFLNTLATTGDTRSELLAGLLQHGVDVPLTTVVVWRQQTNGLTQPNPS